jgi:hypothetical protein
VLRGLPHLRLSQPADYHRALEVLKFQLHNGLLILYLLVLVLLMLLLQEIVDDVGYGVQPLLLLLDLLDASRTEGGDVLLSE